MQEQWQLYESENLMSVINIINILPIGESMLEIMNSSMT